MGESTESIARDKQCLLRNIRDIRDRALKHLRSKITRCEGSGKPGLVIIVLSLMLLVGVPLICWGERILVTYSWLEPVAVVFAVLPIVFMFWKDSHSETEDLLHNHRTSLNGSQRKE